MRIPNVCRAAINFTGVRVRRMRRHQRTAARGLERLTRKLRRSGERLADAPARARARLQRGRAAIERTRNRFRRFDDHVLAPYRTERLTKRALAAAASGRGPIIVGPWTSEVGYEALYWVPFLRWAVDRYGVRPERVVALSRGGAEPWYEGIAARYVEIFDLVDSAEFTAEAAARRERGDQKQMALSPFDRRLIDLACARVGLANAAVWHPGLLYQLFRAFWHGDRSLDFLFRHTNFRYRAATVPSTGYPGLPATYVAVKFYSGPALPDTEDHRRLLHRLVQRLAANVPVVMLDTDWTTDEHRDYSFAEIPGVTTLRSRLDPRTNLAVQTRVIAHARQFVGTCGGLAWLAPFLGVETLAVYADDRYLTAHLYAARHAYRRMEAARFSAVNLAALPRIHAALAEAS
jgi:hypothetical protein